MTSESLWPNVEEFENQLTPKEILEKQSDYLLNATKMLIYAEVETNEIDLLFPDKEIESASFSFEYVLRSKALTSYKFILFTIYHDITIYPVKIKIDSVIKNELGFNTKYATVNNEKDFIDILAKILQSNRTKTIIASMLKLSR